VSIVEQILHRVSIMEPDTTSGVNSEADTTSGVNSGADTTSGVNNGAVYYIGCQ
jgi:hypothetical protein